MLALGREGVFAGHTIGWMSQAYGWAVRQADAGVARLIEAADAAYGRDGYTIVVTADHGGHARTHGSASTDDRLIPWIAYGAGVRPNSELMPGIRTFDTAATVLWALGVPVPEEWAGRPVVSAFEARRPVPVTAMEAGGN
jgi:arylsulfatase A-like enzyme